MEVFLLVLLLLVGMPVVTVFVLKRRWGLGGSVAHYPLSVRLKLSVCATAWPVTLPVLLVTNQQAKQAQATKRDQLDKLLSEPDPADEPSDIPFGSTPPNQAKPHNPFDD